MLCEDVGMSMLFAVFLVSLQSVTSEGSFWSIIAIAGYTAERTVAEGGLSFFCGFNSSDASSTVLHTILGNYVA